MTFENYSKKRGPKCKRPSEEELFKFYSRYNAKRVAQKYGVSVSTVYSWVQYYKNQHKQKEYSTE